MERRRLLIAGTVAGLAAVTACQPDSEPGQTPTPTPRSKRPSRPASPTHTYKPPGRRRRSNQPLPKFDQDEAMRHVEALAGDIGPREATSPAFEQAGEYVTQRFREAGLRVSRQPFEVPTGESWGVRVPSGSSFNVIAFTPRYDPRLPHVVVGAHLDTVPQAPGAEDNASGVAVLLELARLVGRTEDSQTRAALVAFGAEEPRGQGDDRHHYGSRAYVAGMSKRERSDCREMVSMDRVGAGTNVRVRFGGRTNPIGVSGEPVAVSLVSAGYEVGVHVVFEPADTNRSSDHWSFHKGGIPAARVGGNPYSAYHSAADKPSVVDRSMLGATGAVVWEWLNDAPH